MNKFFEKEKGKKALFGLSEREMEVLKLAADGLSNKRVAVQLNIADDTVDTHNRSVVKKLNAQNMKHAIAIAIRMKLI